MESYGEWRVTIYDVYLESLGFLMVTPLNNPNYIENQIEESQPLTVTLRIVKWLRFGELTINSNSLGLNVVKLSRVRGKFIYGECFYKFTACFTECLLFLC